MLTFQQVRELHERAVRLAALGDPHGAIALIERELPSIAPDDRPGLIHSLVDWANGGGRRDVVERYLAELIANDPLAPIIARTRARWGQP